MCLDIVYKRHYPPLHVIRKGWKGFTYNTYSDYYTTPIQSASIQFREGVWDEDPNDGNWLNPPYKLGFHIFDTKEEALVWFQHWGAYIHIKEVEYTDIVAEGRQSGHKVIVAKRVRILCA